MVRILSLKCQTYLLIKAESSQGVEVYQRDYEDSKEENNNKGKKREVLF